LPGFMALLPPRDLPGSMGLLSLHLFMISLMFVRALDVDACK
jgi:hypothetical protein